MPSVNQKIIIDKLIVYFKNRGALDLVEQLTEAKGFCVGFTLLWLKSIHLKFLANEGRLPKEKDPDWFTNTCKFLSEWDEKSSLEPYESQCLKFFEKIFIRQRLQTFVPTVFSVATIGNLAILENLLSKILVHQEEPVLVGSDDHAVGIYKIKNDYYFYDANKKKGDIVCASLEEVAARIFHAFGYSEIENSFFSLSVINFKDNVVNNYPSQKDIQTHLEINNLSDEELLYLLVMGVRENCQDTLEYVLSQISTQRLQTIYNEPFGKEQKTLLHHAINMNSLVIPLFAYYGADFTLADKNGITPFSEAIEIKDDTAVKFLIEKGVDLNTVGPKGLTAFHEIVANRNIDLAEVAIKHGADVNLLNSNDESALHVAVKNNDLAMVDLLIQHGAKILIAGKNGITPLDLVLSNGNDQIMRLFLDAQQRTKQSTAVEEKYNNSSRFFQAKSNESGKSNSESNPVSSSFYDFCNVL